MPLIVWLFIIVLLFIVICWFLWGVVAWLGAVLFVPFVAISNLMDVGNPYKLLAIYGALFVCWIYIDAKLSVRYEVVSKRMLQVLLGAYALGWLIAIAVWFLN